MDGEDPQLQRRDDGGLYEAYVAALFRARGWRVEQTGRTNTPDFGADLLIYSPWGDEPPVAAVQCKHWQQNIDVAAVQAAFAGAAYYAARRAIVVANQPLQGRAKDLANKIGVTVIRVDEDTWRQGIGVNEPELPLPPEPPEEQRPEAETPEVVQVHEPPTNPTVRSEQPTPGIGPGMIGLIVFLVAVLIVGLGFALGAVGSLVVK